LALESGYYKPMQSLKKKSIIAFNISKTIVYSFEYKMLFTLSSIFSAFVKPPKLETDKKLIKHLELGVMELHAQDAQNIIDGIYPQSVLIPKSPLKHFKNIPLLLIDSLKISRRRKLNINKDFEFNSPDVPDYLLRNYHFQTDGYFSEQSAKLYEQQVEILFSGTAAPMRRMLIKLIKENNNNNKSLKILEIGAGVGTATIDFSKSFDFEKYVVSDVSAAYLEKAKKRLGTKEFEYVQAKAEELPFQDNEFDLVISVYLFHELPRSVRGKVLTEAKRVLKPGGLMAICDSLQRDDDVALNEVLENFAIDYHEPFYKDYTLWNATEALENSAFNKVNSRTHLLSKFWVAKK